MGVKVTISNKNSSKSIAIIGASGFIGSNLANYLVSLGKYEVSGSYFTAPSNFVSNEVKQIHVDCQNLESIKKFLGNHEVAIMCAAKTSGAGVIADSPLVHLYQNMIMNTLTLQAAHEVGIKRFIFLSSNTVYPPGEKAMKEGDENDTYFPSYEVVATMKRNTERICLLYPSLKTRPMDVRIVRPANSYGPNDKFDPKLSHVIPALISKMLAANEILEVWGDGKDIKDFIFIEDLIEGIEKIIGYQGEERIFNLVSEVETTIVMILEILKSLTNKPNLHFKFDKSKPKMIPIRRLSGMLAERELNFRAQISLEEGLRRTLNWYLINRHELS